MTVGKFHLDSSVSVVYTWRCSIKTWMMTAIVVMKYSMIVFCSVMLKLNLQSVCACILCIIRLAVFHENWFSGMDAEH